MSGTSSRRAPLWLRRRPPNCPNERRATTFPMMAISAAAWPLSEQQVRAALDDGVEEAQRLAEWIDVKPHVGDPIAELRPHDSPAEHDDRIRQQRQAAFEDCATVQKQRISEEIGAGREPSSLESKLSRAAAAERAPDRRPPRRHPSWTIARYSEERGQQRVRLARNATGMACASSPRKARPRDRRSSCRHQPAIQQRYRRHEHAVPGQTLRVHEPGLCGPKLISSQCVRTVSGRQNDARMPDIPTTA